MSQITGSTYCRSSDTSSLLSSEPRIFNACRPGWESRDERPAPSHRVLKEALRYVVRWGLIHYNPADGVDAPRILHTEIHPPEAADVWAILDLAAGTPYGPSLSFMARTGVRRGECLGLRWRNVDLENGTAAIVESLQRIDRQGLVFLSPKSAKSRRAVALDGPTVAMLREIRGRQILLTAELGDVYRDNGLVFPSPVGDPLDPATLTHNFQKLARRVGVPHVRLHDLRHFHATLLLQAGTHLKIVQERLGHADIGITANIYSHVSPTLQRQAADLFSEAMDRAHIVGTG